MSGLIYTNATLTKITAVGTSPDGGDPGIPGTDRWTGSVGVTVRGPRLEQIGSGRIDEILRTSVTLPYDIGIQVKRGDTLTYSFESVTYARVAGTLIHAAETGRIRVLLEDA
jgi:hypothetical protein